ncbi:PREDICTED: carboxypeptidase B-like [Papilio xuthus]|uniref:Carboxypeptidase B-like n=1 Tax=Papilio xuthus TaxID=66420 RepID=A0AAJ6ZVT5_PAPXU
METWSRTVVLLLVVTVTCSALINELPPGKEWPANNSVKQPFDDDPETTTILILSEKEPSNPSAERLEEVEGPEETITDASLPVLRSTSPESRVDYTGAQIWKVSTQNTNVRGVIYRLRRRNLISTWGGNQSSIDILVKSNAVNNVTRVFKRERIPIEVVIEDLQQRINEENPPLDPNEVELQNRRGHRMTWKQYHRVEDIHGFMDYLAKTYPKIVSVNSIGKSYEGRDLKVLRISDGKPTNKAVFIDGGIHAREWISPATVTYFINQFAENFDVETDDIKNIDWYFLPVVNPDGYEHTHQSDRLWRKNKKPSRTTSRTCIGTDLNRNFGYRWGGKGSSGNPCSEIYRGSSAFSEPESKALSDFIKSSSANFTAYITYHSYGQYLLYPWGYDNAVPPDYKDLDELGNRMASAIRQTRGSSYQVGSSSGLLYPASGGSDDWAKGQGIRYSFTIELSDTGRYGFILPTSFIEPVARESLNGLRVLAAQVAKL